ncbi:hypothetical protein GCM10022276_26050 [Sphingomonas limnosediminicola]|uniref:Uncharacterized protein n=1 Tax=Sphingomonas limnosediminicola TaxID=940133 RepID=A0ABP7LQ94_9SPHN
MDWLARGAVPNDHGLTLVGDADARHPRRIDAAEDFPNDCKRIVPDLLGIVLNAAAAGIMLLQLALRDRDRTRAGIEQDRAT